MIKFSLFKIVKLLTPHHKRTPRFLAWLKVYVSWMEKIMQELYVLWQSSRIEARMTPQIIFLEHLLNTRYGRDPWDILIVEGYQLGPWVYLPEEEAIPQIYVFKDNAEGEVDPFIWEESDAADVDFVVQVPLVLEDEIQVIGATVQKYKLPGKQFVIQLY